MHASLTTYDVTT